MISLRLFSIESLASALLLGFGALASATDSPAVGRAIPSDRYSDTGDAGRHAGRSTYHRIPGGGPRQDHRIHCSYS
jgi:hypothetical protein